MTERDPARIDLVIEEVREFWKRHPDWRLGQVVVNATREVVAHPELQQKGRYISVFHVEDEALIEGLKRLEANER